MSKDDTNWMLFCVQCFASEIDGSWYHLVERCKDDNFCGNCGGHNTACPLPRAAIESIRKQASWVGKRYYPHEEDSQAHLERIELLKLVKAFPGRKALQSDPFNGWWSIDQKMPDGRTMFITTLAENEADAMESVRFSSLPYVSQEQLEAQNEAR